MTLEHLSTSGKTAAVIGILLSVGAGFCWGTFGIARALGPESASLSVAGFRLSFAAIGLILLAWGTGAFKAAGPVSKWPIVPFIICGAGLGSLTWLYLEGMWRAGVSIGAPVSCATIPIISLVLEMIIYKRRATNWQIIGMAVAIFGMTMASYAPDEQIEAGRRLSGVLFAVASGFVFSAYSLYIQHSTNRFPRLMVQANIFTAGAIIMMIWALSSTDYQWFFSFSGVASAMWLGLVSGALGYWLYIKGMRLIPVSIATTLSMVEPLTGTILGIMLLNESTDPLKMLGLIILFAGIIVVGRASTNTRPITEAVSPAST
jgi:DME family drug/metabolite transporter